MQFQTVFREKALARRAEREAIDARLQVTAPHEWLLVSGLAVALVGLVAYGLIAQVERTLVVETVLVHPGERADLVSGVSGLVVEVLPTVGEVVAAGQLIARVRTLEAERPSLEAAQGGDEQSATRDIVAPFDGEVVALALAVGRLVAAGELAARIRTVSDGPMEALGFVTREEAMQLAAGMQARVRLAVPGDRASGALPARVELVSPRVVRPARWLTELGLEPPARAHLVRATLTDAAPPAAIDGAPGTLRVVLGHRSFVSLLFGNGAR